MMGSARLLLLWSVFFASTFDLVLAAGNLKGVQHAQNDGQTIRQLETVPMADEQESTPDNAEDRGITELGSRVKSFVTSHLHLSHKDEQSTLRTAEDASQHVKPNDENLKKAKSAVLVAKAKQIEEDDASDDFFVVFGLVLVTIMAVGAALGFGANALLDHQPK